MGKVYPFCHRIASFQHASRTESHPILFKNRGGDNARLKWIQLRFAEGKFLFDRTKFTTTASAAHYQQQFRRLPVVSSKTKNSNNKTNQVKEKGKKGRWLQEAGAAPPAGGLKLPKASSQQPQRAFRERARSPLSSAALTHPGGWEASTTDAKISCNSLARGHLGVDIKHHTHSLSWQKCDRHCPPIHLPPSRKALPQHSNNHTLKTIKVTLGWRQNNFCTDPT